ncbi:MAG: tRNA (adenosine(37)-N6)-threonylcarbamoyltransferase complex ATPase subunit type 1 TsaE [Sphingobacteriales bacterium]|nr:MAG: tRNA (adenosine(37)-N6)-threonylcarbamoyltransferase complex ATPase subunit type 1 TsaE [Sphingobacteriales bacterium]
MSTETLQISYALAEISAVVTTFRNWCGPDARVFVFSGDLGAGKTTFIRELCRQWQVTDAVSSPTFSLVNEYRTQLNETVYHMDFYRLRSAAEAIDAGLEELVNTKHARILIEWPEQAQSILPSPRIQVEIACTDPESRLLQAAWA